MVYNQTPFPLPLCGVKNFTLPFCREQAVDTLERSKAFGIVDPRFRDTDYRTSQSYVGQSISYQKQLVHYICPKPDDLAVLMDGLFSAHRTLQEGSED